MYSTYLSFLEPDKFSYKIPTHSDPRGVFCEILKTKDSGQFSFTAHPGVVRGGHYHHTKTEKFLVLKGMARFGFRHIISNTYYELEVTGDEPTVVNTVPGWCHNIANIGTEELVCMLWQMSNLILKIQTHSALRLGRMSKLKVMTVVGTRPEIIRLSRVMAALDKYCDHTLVHTGQNYDYELNQVFFDDLGVREPDYFLASADGSASAATIGNLITAVDHVLAERNPEALLVLGDTNSCLSVIPAKRRKIPIFHMEAGNRCFDQRVPEETNRRIVDHVADINLTTVRL